MSSTLIQLVHEHQTDERTTPNLGTMDKVPWGCQCAQVQIQGAIIRIRGVALLEYQEI